MEESNVTIHSLPVEILGHVLSWLDDDELLSAASVSRHWFNVINQYLLRRKQSAILRPDASDFIPDWRLEKVSLIGYSGLDFENVRDVCVDVDKLHISYDDSIDHVLDETDLTKLLNNCERLTELSFKNVLPNCSSLQIIQKHGFDKLQTLSFECQSDQLNKDKIEKCFNQLYFPEVKLMSRPRSRSDSVELHARYPFIFNSPINFIQVPMSVTTLQIDCSGLSKDAYNCLRFCTKLQSIVLLNAVRVEDDAIMMLSKLPRLTSVSVSDAQRVTAAGWMSLCSQNNISSISLVRCITGLSDDVFNKMAATKKLLNIDLQGCKRVTRDSLISLLCKSEQLFLTLDYNEEQLDYMVQIISSELAVHLHALNVSVQRVHATSAANSVHLTDFQNALAVYSNSHNMRFSFQELFTKVERSYRPVSTT